MYRWIADIAGALRHCGAGAGRGNEAGGTAAGEIETGDGFAVIGPGNGAVISVHGAEHRDTPPTNGGNGRREITSALGESRRLFVSIALFSVFVNVLMLTGPLFMLQVYDRVLTSRSEATLVAPIGIVAFLFLMMGLLDYFGGRGAGAGRRSVPIAAGPARAGPRS